ncbi:hypothetical protein PAEPH01_2657, partial [Pancytospora epiphaga]
MPRDGWSKCHSIFCDTFKCSISFNEFRKQANFVITSNSGARCSRKRFAEESTKRVKTLDEHLDERTLHEAKVYLEIKQRYFILRQGLREGEIDEAKRTRKFTREQVDSLRLRAIDRAAGEYAASYLPVSMSGIARQLQAAQQCYEEATLRERPKSTWRESIEKKIADNKAKITILEAKSAGKELSGKDLTVAKRVMRELNLVLDLKRDFMKGISILEDRVRVYKSKLHSSEQCQVFRADNRCFELYGRCFYRRMTEEQPLEHDVPEEDIVAFWS